ncbi:ABC transporter substrate-binding protein SapA [Lacimicrobium alkaliphilum]|uniref:Peptide ABC transporter substrate-binding protein n=1 Tax=Lacimicrobium alkaliphilum TaxID=1526571 RepID=A0A0U3AY69_9ALTE|nr:peptide ABC transporter substrate-binding protein [Lacimicrobium alkaliphilum]
MKHHFHILLCALIISGCQKAGESELTRQGLVYCSEGSPVTFNPQLDISGTTADATSHQLYNRLIDFDPQTGKLVPSLASSWSVSRDGLTYAFQLRKHVNFHQTPYFRPSRSFDAKDVLFSINRWRDPNHPYHDVSGGRYPYFESLGLQEIIKDVSLVNGFRVEIKLNYPDSSFLATLATDFAVILSQEYASQLMSENTPELLDTRPIGTGPFKFDAYRKDAYIRYRRHDGYWEGNQSQQQLIYDITPRSSLRLAKLITGECDVIAYPAQTELQVIEERPDLVLEERPGLNVGFWAFNTAKPPFDDARVRRALALAVDRKTLLDAVYFDTAVAARGLLPPSSWAFDENLQESSYNPVQAKKLLQEAGIDSGFSMTIWAMPIERAYNPNATKMAELIQHYLAEVGIQVRIVSHEWSTFRRLLLQGQHDSVLIGWSADNGDPDNFYRPLLSCSAISSGSNRANWCSAEYDQLINQAVRTADESVRMRYYQKANQILADQVPLVPIAHAYRFQAHRKGLTGMQINPFGGISFANVSKETD